VENSVAPVPLSVAKTDTAPDAVAWEEGASTERVPLVATLKPVRTLFDVRSKLMGVTSRFIETLCDCEPLVAVTVTVKRPEIEVVDIVSELTVDHCGLMATGLEKNENV